MKRIALVASVFLFAACAPKAEEAAPAADAMATTPAAPAMDSAAMTDTTKKDSTAVAAPADTTKH